MAPPENQFRVSPASPFAANCETPTAGTSYVNSEVEPHLAVNPANPSNWIAVWQQDRWSNGSARGTRSAVTFDGGASWISNGGTFSVCGGGTAGNGGNYQRATDPWAAFAPNGTAFQMALATSGTSFTAGSSNAMLVARSTDGGLTWAAPTTLIADGSGFFNDKNTITADPTDARYVYAAWDRLVAGGGGPAIFARSTDNGLTWEAARAIYNPGVNAQTIGNVVVVLPSGVLLYVFTQINFNGSTATGAFFGVSRSLDKGATWSAPVQIATFAGIGARDPDTGTRIRDASSLLSVAAAPSGSVYAVWQDARFSSGARDAIALSRSLDGGQSWSSPVRVNAAAEVAAFVPTVHVLADNTIAVSYFDLRSNTADPQTLGADAWLARSRDGGVGFSETRIAGPFDLAIAPLAATAGTTGYFVGDYMGLASSGDRTVAAFVQTTNTDLANRTDVFVKPVAAATATSVGAQRAASAAPLEVDGNWGNGDWTARSREALEFQLDRRGAEWRKARGR